MITPRALPLAEVPAYLQLRRTMLAEAPWAFLSSPDDRRPPAAEHDRRRFAAPALRTALGDGLPASFCGQVLRAQPAVV